MSAMDLLHPTRGTTDLTGASLSWGASESSATTCKMQLHSPAFLLCNNLHFRSATFYIFILQQTRLAITDISLHKDMPGIILHAFQILQIAGIGKLVQVDESYILMMGQHVVDEVAAYEASAACDEVGSH